MIRISASYWGCKLHQDEVRGSGLHFSKRPLKCENTHKEAQAQGTSNTSLSEYWTKW